MGEIVVDSSTLTIHPGMYRNSAIQPGITTTTTTTTATSATRPQSGGDSFALILHLCNAVQSV